MATQTESLPTLMTMEEVARELGITVRSVYKMIARKELAKPVRFPKGGRTVRIRRRDFVRYVESLAPAR